MKKRFVCLLLTVCLCVLAGCHASDPENRFKLSEPPETEVPNTMSAETTEDGILPQPSVPVDLSSDIDPAYNYGNMQIDVPAGNFVLYDGGVLIWVTWGGRQHMYSYDLDTGELQLVCQDATCDHESVECPIGGCHGNLEGCQGELYTKSPAGTLLKMKDWKWEGLLNGSVSLFCHRGKDLYVITADQSLLAYENGSTKPRMLVEEFPYDGCVVIENYLYAHSLYLGQVVRVNLTTEQPELEVVLENAYGRVDGTHIYYMNFTDGNKFYRCDINGENSEKLTDCEIMAENFDNEYVYFRYKGTNSVLSEEGHDLYRFPKDDPNKIEKIAALPEYIYRIYTVPGANLLFVYVWPEGGRDQEKPTMIYVMNRDGSNPQLLSFPDA